MEGYLWLYIFLLAGLPWWWRINHPSCLFPEWCSAVLLNTTASLNLNVRSPSAAAQDKANQHQMPPRWTYCLALESLTLSLLLINIIQPNPRVHFSQTTVKPSPGPGSSSEVPSRRRGDGRRSAYDRRTKCTPRHIAGRDSFLHPLLLSNANTDWGTLNISSHREIHPTRHNGNWSWTILIQHSRRFSRTMKPFTVQLNGRPFSSCTLTRTLTLVTPAKLGLECLRMSNMFSAQKAQWNIQSYPMNVTYTLTNVCHLKQNSYVPLFFFNITYHRWEGETAHSCFSLASRNYNEVPLFFLKKRKGKSQPRSPRQT